MSDEVPMLPIVIPFGVAFFLVLLWVLRSRGRVTLPRVSVAGVLALYAGGVVANTVFPIFVGPSSYTGPRPLPLDLRPVVGYEPADAALNVAVFVPLGILIALLLERPTWWRVLLIAAGASAGIEATQFVTAQIARGGHIADIDDWMSNTLGGVVGYALFALAIRLPVLASVVDRFRWPARAQRATAG